MWFTSNTEFTEQAVVNISFDGAFEYKLELKYISLG
jgi:hypothetical protein